MALDIDLKNLGNFPDYKHEPRIAKSGGLVSGLAANLDNTIFKFYEMHKKDEPIREEIIDEAKRFLIVEIVGFGNYKRSFSKYHSDKYKKERAEIDKSYIPFSASNGMGFAILAKDTLNIAAWDKKNPIIIKNKLYTYDESKVTSFYGENSGRFFNNLKSLDISEEGPFCVWELGIVAHERNAWMEYLQSNKTDADKEKYLTDVIEGEL